MEAAKPAGAAVASVRFLLRDSAIYGLSNALVKLTTLVTVPVMTRALSQAEYGATDALSVMLALLVAFSTIGQDSAVARYYYDVGTDADRRKVVSQGLTAQLVMCVIVGVIAVLLGPRILASESGAALSEAYYLAVATLPFVLLFQFWRGLLKWVLARSRFVALSVGSSLMTLGVVAGLAFAGSLTVRSYFAGLLVTNLAAAAVGAWFCRAYISRPGDFAFLRPMLRFGAPYAAVLLVGTAIPAVDRAIITLRVGLAPLGEYAVGVKYASLLLFPVMAFQTAWGPFSYSTYRQENAASVYSRVLRLFASGLAIACFALVALSEPLIAIFASAAYVSAAPIVIPIVFALAAEACSWIVGIGIDLSKRSELSLASYIIGLLVAAGSAWLLVESFGILGVAAGMSLGRIVQSLVYGAFGLRAYPMPLDWRGPSLILGTAFLLAVGIQLVEATSPIQVAGLRLAAFLLLTVVIVERLGETERRRVAEFARRLRGVSLRR